MTNQDSANVVSTMNRVGTRTAFLLCMVLATRTAQAPPHRVHTAPVPTGWKSGIR